MFQFGKRKTALFGMAMLVVSSVACQPKAPIPVVAGPTGEPTPPPPPPKDEDEKAAQALADDATRLETSGDKSGAEKKRDTLVDTYPGTAAGARVLRQRAETFDRDGDVERAVQLYERLLFNRPSFDGADAVRERYAMLLLNLERFADAAAMLRALYDAAKEPASRGRLGLALGQAYMGAAKEKDALYLYVDLTTSDVPADAKGRANAQALDLVAQTLPFKDAEGVWNETQGKETWGFVLPALAYKLAKIYYHTRDYDRSETMLKLVAARFGDSPYGAPARDFLTRLKARFKVDPLTIGVVLPLSGKYQQYGERALKAIKLSLTTHPNLKLVVKDTNGEPAAAAKAVEELVLESNAIAIVGPLFSNEAQAAALKAEELSVPIITLSHRAGLPEIGEWVFRTALTVRAQATDLARVAMDKLKLSRFAVLYPRSTYGQEFVDAFWEEVEKKGGEIRGAESYEHDATSFQEPIKKLVGRYYLYARNDYREKLRELRAQKLPSHKLQQALDKFEKGIPPLVDFDAIVIPDGAKNIGLIAPALAFEDIVLTRDPKMLEKIRKAMNRKDVPSTQLLGASTWNSAQTVEACEEHCERAVFVDAYYPDSPDPRVLDFVASYRDAVGGEPTLNEAQAFDTAGLLKTVLANAKPTTRKALQEALLKLPAYDGVTGKMHFNKDGDIEKSLSVLTIIDRAIRLWEPEPETPRG